MKGMIMSSTNFLSRVLFLDALSCAGLGLGMALAAPSLSPALGLPAGLVQAAGLILLPLALFIGWLASRPSPPRLLVWLVIVGNLGWTAESFALLGQYSASITGLGSAFVVAQAVAVLALSGLEYVGLRRIRAAA